MRAQRSIAMASAKAPSADRQPRKVGDVRTLAILVVVCSLGGIARS
jgi:hypothetical protein